MSPPVVIVAMSVDAVTDRAAFAELAEVTGATIAYLQNGDPTLTERLDELAASGADRIRLVRFPSSSAAPARSWLRRVASHWVREHPEVDVEIVASAVTAREAALRSPAWEDVPGHRCHVLVCRGPRCSASGSGETSRVLDEVLSDRGLGDDEVLVAQTGCLYPCNHAPVVVVHPDDVWYGPVTPADAPTLVDEHLIAGRPLAHLRRPRQSGAPLSERKSS